MIPREWHGRWNGFWLRAHPTRALGEALLAQGPVLLCALVFVPRTPFASSLRGAAAMIVIAGPCCILYCAFRMRRLPLRWWWRLALYGSIGVVLGIVPTVVLSLLWRSSRLYATVPPQTGIGRFPIVSFAAIWLLAFACAFLISRVGVRLIVLWNQLRRHRLIWALTNAHLLVVILGACLLTAVLVLFTARPSPSTALTLLPMLFFIFIVTVLILLVVLPPSALFSYLFSRQITRRLEALADATSALRAGDYGVRVSAQGEDEVAQLQANFNAMAADLERAMRELKAERDNVATLLTARRELIASVSHELRTPVATLRGYLESARAHWDGTPPPTLPQDLATMERETLRLQTLIDDLFTLARAEVGQLEARREATDIALVARRVVETMAPLAWQTIRVEVVVSVSEAVPAALADASRVEQVLSNLIRNGVRHTPPGGIVAVEVSAKDNAVLLRVRDTGEGIAPEDLPRIWDRFYRTRRSREQDSSGTGLGLALVKELTEAMGGSVAVESILGEGSCFTVRLAQAEQVEADDKTQQARNRGPRTPAALRSSS